MPDKGSIKWRIRAEGDAELWHRLIGERQTKVKGKITTEYTEDTENGT